MLGNLAAAGSSENMKAMKQGKANNSMLNAMPGTDGTAAAGGRKLIGEQPDIVTRRHKISGSGGLNNPTSAVQKLHPGSSASNAYQQ